MAEVRQAQPQWIDSNEALAAAVARCGPVIAVDTEFMRTSTYFPIPGLYQIGTEQEIFLVDPQAIDDWQPLQALLEAPDRSTVMHACSEDLEVFNNHLGLAPSTLFDSQLAHAFLSTDYSISYARLVDAYCGVELDKGATRSDWLQRPLTQTQIFYAAADVRYLVEIRQQQRDALEALGRWRWFEEESRRHTRYQAPYPERYYLQMKGAWRLADEALQRLQALAAWREGEAMALDRPRSRVVKDDVLLALASADYFGEGLLHKHLPGGAVRRFGGDLARAWAGEDPVGEPLVRPEPPLTVGQSKVVTALKRIATAQAETLGLAPELLGRKRDLEAALRSHLRGEGLGLFSTGWRAPLLENAFLDALQAAA
ncbi:MAG: HRDC domain-containing protein [Pseudomonadota bacterium]